MANRARTGRGDPDDLGECYKRPAMRGVEANNFVVDGEPILQLSNREQLTDECLRMPQAFGLILQYFDGQSTTEEIARIVRDETGVNVSPDMLDDLVETLDSALLLDSPTYEAARETALREYRDSGVRQPSCAGGVYSKEPDRARKQLRRIFEQPQGAGLPSEAPSTDEIRAVFVPHIDYGRGGPSFGYAFRAIAERSQADLFVVVATSHYSPQRFTLTRNDFATPLGLVRTDRDYVDAIARIYGEEEAYRDELAHRPEHSIELELLLLQFVLEGKREFSIVPLLVGPFQDAVADQREPNDFEEVQRMTSALRKVEADSGKRVCYIVSGDLAHIGPKFGDAWTIDMERSAWNRAADARLIETLVSADPAALHQSIQTENDERRICGYPPAYTMLSAARPGTGVCEFSDQFVDPNGNEIVSFATIVYPKA